MTTLCAKLDQMRIPRPAPADRARVAAWLVAHGHADLVDALGLGQGHQYPRQEIHLSDR